MAGAPARLAARLRPARVVALLQAPRAANTRPASAEFAPSRRKNRRTMPTGSVQSHLTMRAQDPLGRTRGAPWPEARALVARRGALTPSGAPSATTPSELRAQLDDVVEGEPVRALDPLLGRAALGVDRPCRITEAE